MPDTRDAEAVALLDRLTDDQFVQAMIAGHLTCGAVHTPMGSYEQALAQRSARVLSALVESQQQLAKAEHASRELFEDLSVERASNRRMKCLLVDLAAAMPGNPATYPAPFSSLVARVQKEV